MKRIIVGVFLIAHGLAHVNAGMLASDGAMPGAVATADRGLGLWVATALWATAMVGFVTAGVALLGLAPRRVRWRPCAIAAVAGSLALALVYDPPTMPWAILLDLAIALLLWRSAGKRAWDERVHDVSHHRGKARRVIHRLSHGLAAVFVAYLLVLVTLRPWHMRWGTTDDELRGPRPGDAVQAFDARYRIDHAITIRAPADSVWAWVAQIGQDRAGFYSYAWLERLIGDDITNADSIVPGWGERNVGDLVRATQSDYLGGRFGSDLGWRIDQFEPNRVMVLRGWGAFIVEPIDARTTRFHVRTRGDGKPNVTLAPLGFLVFEPAHVIMERGMLLGIKARAEGRMPS